MKRLFESDKAKADFAKFTNLEKNLQAELILSDLDQTMRETSPLYAQYVEELVLLGSNLAPWAVKESLNYHPSGNDIDFGIILKEDVLKPGTDLKDMLA
jgi:hypothetical protein